MTTHRLTLSVLLGALFTFTPGCSLFTNCSTPCSRLYDEDQCGIQRPGSSQDELYDLCVEQCAEAAGEDGEVGDYDPYSQTPIATAVNLENRAQVELWSDCIDETSCEYLQDGYCAPVY